MSSYQRNRNVNPDAPKIDRFASHADQLRQAGELAVWQVEQIAKRSLTTAQNAEFRFKVAQVKAKVKAAAFSAAIDYIKTNPFK